MVRFKEKLIHLCAAFVPVCLTAALTILACRNIENAAATEASSQKEITAFKLEGTAGEINYGKKTITVVLPEEQTLDNLKAEIKYVGESISPVPEEPRDYTEGAVFTVTAQDGSKVDYTVSVQKASSTKKQITEFIIPGVTIVEIKIDETAGTISIVVPRTVEQNIFTPEVTHSGTKYVPTGPVNFSSPVTYTVWAADASKKSYRITITREPSGENSIQKFILLGCEGDISGTDIRVDVPYSLSGQISNAAPSEIAHNGIRIEPAAEDPQNFANSAVTPVTYTVTSEKGTLKTYSVRVYAAPNTAADIQVFRLEGALGTINGTNISVTVPYETNLSVELVPEISHNGASIDPPADTERIFSGVVTYEVTAEDGTTKKTYSVTVTEALCPNKEITQFILPYAGGSAEGQVTGSSAVTADGNITGSAVTVVVPNGINISLLTPQIDISELAVISPNGAQNFENDVVYTVTAEDGTTQQYTVTVVPADPASKSIINFNLPGQINYYPMIDHGEDSDDEGKITVLMPLTANLSALTPTITHSGRTIQGADQPHNFDDFGNPVIYTVEAGDGSEKPYRVKIIFPVLPPITDEGQGFTVGFDKGGGTGLEQGPIYKLFDNNLSTIIQGGAKNNINETVSVTWDSGVKTVNRIRIIRSTTASVQFMNLSYRTAENTWQSIAEEAVFTPGSFEYILTLPEAAAITGIRGLFRKNGAQKTRLTEFILEHIQ